MNIEDSEFGNSWEFAWLASWLMSPLGTARPVLVGDVGDDGWSYSIQIEINSEPGVALVYDDGELVMRIIHPECNG